jgi:hypothetical protein
MAPKCGAVMVGGGGWTMCAREPNHKGSHLEAPGTWWRI